MKDRHIYSAEDQLLLKKIVQNVEAELAVDRRQFKTLLWAKFIFYLTVSSTTYLLLLSVESAGVFIVCFAAYGFSILLFAFNFAHDFSHGTVFKRPSIDHLGFTLIYALNGAHAEAWKKRHIESHHFAPNVEHYDSDLEISSLIRVLPQSKFIWYHRFQHIYAPVAYMTYSLYWIFIKDFYLFFRMREKRFRYKLSFFLQKTFYIVSVMVLPILFSHQTWYVVLEAFLFMHFVQSLFLLLTFFMTHHVEGVIYPTTDKNGYINISWTMNQIKSSNDMYPFSRFANFIFGGFNNHIAHHLFPNVHHIHYPELNRSLYKTLRENGIEPNYTSYWEGICSHFRLLKRMAEAGS